MKCCSSILVFFWYTCPKSTITTEKDGKRLPFENASPIKRCISYLNMVIFQLAMLLVSGVKTIKHSKDHQNWKGISCEPNLHDFEFNMIQHVNFPRCKTPILSFFVVRPSPSATTFSTTNSPPQSCWRCLVVVGRCDHKARRWRCCPCLATETKLGEFRTGKSNEQWKKTGWLFDIGDEILPNYIGIIISHYKDPY